MVLHLDEVPHDRPVVLLMRHSVRDDLPPEDVGYLAPITEVGWRLARALGERLLGRMVTLHTSPLTRCIQTAVALREGAGVQLEVVEDRLLGDPGAYVLDGARAWSNWQQLDHLGVMDHLVSQSEALPGMARPDEAARFLVQHMMATAGDVKGIHVFISHDSLVTATAARILGLPLSLDDWPLYLEGAFFWRDEDVLHVAYRGRRGGRPGPVCALTQGDVLEFARREIAATLGLDSGASFSLVGGAFKSLLTGRRPRDLDLWAPSDSERRQLLTALRARGARPTQTRRFSDVFELEGREIDVPHEVMPTLDEGLDRCDIALSAVGVAHGPRDEWSVRVHPLAAESVRRRQVLLIQPLVNWRYALTTLERMRRYALDLQFESPASEETAVWRVYDAQSPEERAKMLRRYHATGRGGFGVLEEVACRFR